MKKITLETAKILSQIADERARQDENFGKQKYSQAYFMNILMEEVGECARAVQNRNYDNMREELIQVAAVAALMVESLDSFGFSGEK